MGMFGQGLGRLAATAFLGTNEMSRRDELKRQRAMQDAVMAANREAGGLMSPAPGAMRQMQIGNQEGADITDAFGPAMEQGPSRQRSPQEIAAALADLQGRVPGFNSKPFADIAAFAKPEYTNFDGQITDKATGKILREVPGIEKSQRRVYDEQGNVVGVMDLAGAVQSIAGRKEAETLGATRGTLREVPVGGGATRLMTGRNYLDQSPVNSELGYTPPAAQLAADQARAVGAATGDVERQQARLERAAAAPRQLMALDEMERLLPDVISGFGSDVRINTARAMALAGNEEAARKVAATETFINQGRILVAGIIKTFGSNPTEGERKFAEKMSGADAELNPETLKEGIRLQRERIFRELEDAGKPAASTRAPAAPSRAALEAEARRRGLM